MYPSDFRTSFSGLSQEGWEMELERVGVEDCGTVGPTEASPSETPVAMGLEVISGGGQKRECLV